ncbi:MAG: LPS export ABC transporter ATP-binding protein [Planctomycetes bacterium]|nr:LPS export ABC transporter ATP-binding protein [Planctomycetota bacterium]
MSLLDVKGLVKSYGGHRVVDGVDISLKPGEIVGLLGPNGAGKTTTFRMVMGMIPAEEGEVLLDGENISHQPMYQRARLGMGYLAQEPSIFRRMTVEDNIMAILETLPISRREREERLAELLTNLSLTRLSQNMADTLSGGERRRLEITRALVIDPMVLLLDEPFSGVDPVACAEIQKIIAALRANGMSILLTDHNVWETLTITDRAYIIHDGKVLIHGSAKELIENPEAQRLYLGDRFVAVQESFMHAREKIESKSHQQHAGLRMRRTTRMVKAEIAKSKKSMQSAAKKAEATKAQDETNPKEAAKPEAPVNAEEVKKKTD